MELMFNELSVNPPCVNKYDANEKASLFSETAAEARRRNISHIRTNKTLDAIKLLEDYTLKDWLNDKSFSKTNRTFRDFLFSIFVTPFINEDDINVEDNYSSAHYFFEDIENGIKKTECLGLASAYLYDTLSISFKNGKAWTKNVLNIIIEPDKGASYIKQVKNVFSKDCFNVQGICDFLEKSQNTQLIETEILPESKSIHLAGDHHGKEKLYEFWRKLQNSPYVLEARSTDFCRGHSKFVYKIEPDGNTGVIVLVPVYPYTLWIQTTGRNYHETESIAKELYDEYS
jgi:hypothetical protein